MNKETGLLEARIADLEMQLAGKQMLLDKEFLKEVNLEPIGLAADRDCISDAVKYNKMIWETLDGAERISVEVAFYVFWNTLAKHYELYKIEEDTNV